MLKRKRAASVVLSAAMILSMGAAAGCSTPAVAMTVGNDTYSTGDYLAYLYNTYSQVYQNYNFALYDNTGWIRGRSPFRMMRMRKSSARRSILSKPRRTP